VGHTLPHNSEAEAAVLGGVLLHNETLNDILDVVRVEDFYVPGYRSVFRAMTKLAERGQPLDIVTLEAQLRAADELALAGGLEGLGKLADRYASSHNIVRHAGLVREAATVRNLVVAAQDIVDRGREGVEEPMSFVDEAESKILAINQGGRRGSYRHVHDLLQGVFVSITERASRKNPITGVPTGFPELDLMTGGLQPGDLVILAARPSMGKTALALNMAQHACITSQAAFRRPEDDRPPNYPTLFFSLEMSAPQLIERVLCSEARVDATKLRSGHLVEEDFVRLVQAADRVDRSKLFIDDSATLSILEIRARARRFRNDRSLFSNEGRQLGLVVVDYLQLVRGGSKSYDIREQEISEVSRGLKAMAKELEVPVVALSQLNRSVDSRADHRPQLSDLRESGAIEQDSDLIMFIYREERYLAADAPDDKRRAVENKAEVIVGKQRNGPTGTVNLTFLGKYARFESSA